jgi:hypothetical protein
MVELYVDRAREIYTGVPILNTLRRVFTGSMYSTRKLRDVISGELGPEARGWSLNDSPIDLLMTAKGVPAQNRRPSPWRASDHRSLSSRRVLL